MKKIKITRLFEPNPVVGSPHRYHHPDDWMYEDDTQPLLEMSLPRTEVWKKLVQYDSTIEEHLLKLFYFREYKEYFQSWSNAVYKSAFRTYKIKAPKGKKDKLPDAQTIYDWMWSGSADDFDIIHSGWIKGVNNKSLPDYQDLPYIHAGGNEKNAGEFIKAYHLWLAKELSAKERIYLPDVQDEIKLLFKKYLV
jgi:hypothetical protein